MQQNTQNTVFGCQVRCASARINPVVLGEKKVSSARELYGARVFSRPADRKAVECPRTVCQDADLFTRTCSHQARDTQTSSCLTKPFLTSLAFSINLPCLALLTLVAWWVFPEKAHKGGRRKMRKEETSVERKLSTARTRPPPPSNKTNPPSHHPQLILPPPASPH